MIFERHYVLIGAFIFLCLGGSVHVRAQQRSGAGRPAGTLASGAPAYEGAPLISYVNPLTGTAASTTAEALRHGTGTEELANTLPSVTYPFGMTQWVAQTEFSETKCVAPYCQACRFAAVRGDAAVGGGAAVRRFGQAERETLPG